MCVAPSLMTYQLPMPFIDQLTMTPPTDRRKKLKKPSKLYRLPRRNHPSPTKFSSCVTLLTARKSKYGNESGKHFIIKCSAAIPTATQCKIKFIINTTNRKEKKIEAFSGQPTSSPPTSLTTYILHPLVKSVKCRLCVVWCGLVGWLH